jgi:hypothetical protein
MIDNPNLQHLFGTTFDNMCFFFEEALPSFFENNKSQKLDKLGAFAIERWSHIARVHCVFPQCKGQAYFVSRLDTTHYQDFFCNFVSKVAQYRGNCQFSIYYPQSDYSNSYLVLLNTQKSLQPFLSAVPWDEVQGLLATKVASHRGYVSSPSKSRKTTLASRPSEKRQEQGGSLDFGFTSCQSVSRKKSTTGVSVPCEKQNMTQGVIQCMVVASDMVRATKLPWCDAPCIDKDHPVLRQQRFAGTFDPSNLMEAIRLHVSGPGSLCRAHSDQQNSKKESMAVTVGLSKGVVGVSGMERIGFTTYSRLSIDYSLKESVATEPFLDAIILLYRALPQDLKVITEDIVKGPKEYPLPGIPCIIRDCHMNPLVYHSPVVYMALQLFQKFQLTFHELTSVVVCFEHLPSKVYVFVVAALSLLNGPFNGCKRPRGYDFGYMLLMNMDIVKQSLAKEKAAQKGKPKHRSLQKFAVYRQLHVPGVNEWYTRCGRVVSLCMEAHHLYQKPGANKETRAQNYRALHEAFLFEAKNVGPLIANHSLGILSLLGLIPAWFRRESEFNTASKYMTHFSDKYYNTIFSKTKMLQVVSSLQRALVIETEQAEVDLRVVENIMCKTYRMEKGNFSSYCEIILPGQLVFRAGDQKLDEVRVIDPSGQQRIVKPSLITQWPCGTEYISTSKLVAKMDYGIRQLSSTTSVHKFPHEIICPQVCFPPNPLPFPLPDCFMPRNGITLEGQDLLNKFMSAGKVQFEERIPIPRRSRRQASN